MKTKRNKLTAKKRKTLETLSASTQRQAFVEHFAELRRRLFWVAASVGVGASLAYTVQHHIVAVLLKPAEGQQFIYTSPGGGLDFLVRVCIFTGLACSIPVIVYNVLKFLEPLLHDTSTKYILRGSIVAGLLAVLGIMVGYFLGLPNALHFLAHQFTTEQVKALITIQAYMGFVTKYLLAAALMFQAPLVMLFINKMRPLQPKKLFAAERWVIVGSMILAAVINPAPDIMSMLVIAGPMIAAYQVGIVLVWRVNRTGKRSKSVLALLEQDAALQAERLRRLEAAWIMPLVRPLPQLVPEPISDGVYEQASSPYYDQPPAYDPLPRQSMRPQSKTVQLSDMIQSPLVQLTAHAAQTAANTTSSPIEGRSRADYRYAVRPQRVRRKIM
jgi:sec-independent protein translocase protein TatC